MRQYPVWLCLTFLGALGTSLTAGCDPTNSVVGKVQAPVDGDPCATAGDKATAADGCNQCTCGADTQWVCTEKACTPDPGGKPDPTAPVCKDGETKVADDGCNKCSCEEGAWACTLMDCGGGEPSSCKPGETMRPDVCNECKCGDDGNWSCTKMDCGGTTTPPPCKPGDTKADDCNKCFCDDAGNWSCTLMDCGAPTPPSCKPGEMMKPDDCNVCKCSDDGNWSCTKMDCGGTTPQVCKPGETKPDDCNVCSCNADGTGWMCTTKACPVPECKPGDTKHIDCNGCWCTTAGTWACSDVQCAGECPPTLITEAGHPYDEKQACLGSDLAYFGCAMLDDPTLVIPEGLNANMLCAKLIKDGTLFLVNSRVSSTLFAECSPDEGKKVMSATFCP